MGFSERLGWLLLGCLIGYFVGYIVRGQREIKEEVDEIDQIVKEKRTWRRKDDDGFMRFPIVRDIAILIVVVATVFAAFAAQNATNDAHKANERLSQVTVCTSEYLARTIRALNARTDSVQARADSNLKLQKAQAKFFALILEEPPRPETARRNAAEEYLDALTMFVQTNAKAERDVEAFPYPTNAELQDCLNKEQQ